MSGVWSCVCLWWCQLSARGGAVKWGGSVAELRLPADDGAPPAQNGYAWWETAAVMGTQVSLCIFNCWFLIASWTRRR